MMKKWICGVVVIASLLGLFGALGSSDFGEIGTGELVARSALSMLGLIGATALGCSDEIKEELEKEKRPS